MAGDRTRIDCLEGNHADHYTTIAEKLLYLKIFINDIFMLTKTYFWAIISEHLNPGLCPIFVEELTRTQWKWFYNIVKS